MNDFSALIVFVAGATVGVDPHHATALGERQSVANRLTNAPLLCPPWPRRASQAACTRNHRSSSIILGKASSIVPCLVSRWPSTARLVSLPTVQRVPLTRSAKWFPVLDQPCCQITSAVMQRHFVHLLDGLDVPIDLFRPAKGTVCAGDRIGDESQRGTIWCRTCFVFWHSATRAALVNRTRCDFCSLCSCAEFILTIDVNADHRRPTSDCRICRRSW